MKKHIYVMAALVVLVMAVAGTAFSQEKTLVKVKNSEIITGVVIVHVQKDAKALDLQCNEGASGCKVLPSGNYLMVALPPNFGLYDCKNVEIYRGEVDKPQAAEKIGEYCLAE